jgi:hypothetical protein
VLVDRLACVLTDLSLDDFLFMGHQVLLSGPGAFLHMTHALLSEQGQPGTN